jgi:AraC-like DNA-binding protein
MPLPPPPGRRLFVYPMSPEATGAGSLAKDDHSSALFVALIREALIRQGIRPPPPECRAGRAPLTPLVGKKSLIDDVLRTHGPSPLLRIGVALNVFTDTPLAGVLGSASDPANSLARWRRLERYFHSRNRTRVAQETADSVLVEHFSSKGPAPGPAENMVVAAVQAALVAWLGAGEVSLDFVDDRAIWHALRSGEVVVPCPDQPPISPARWRLSWSGFTPNPDLRWSKPAEEVRWVSSGLKLDDATLRQLYLTMLADPGRRFTVDGCARELAVSKRTLQRRLADAGASFSDVVALVRLETASRALVEGETPLAAVGFLAGYSDQAHFSREFRKGIGMPPSTFRELSKRASAATGTRPLG